MPGPRKGNRKSQLGILREHSRKVHRSIYPLYIASYIQIYTLQTIYCTWYYGSYYLMLRSWAEPLCLWLPCWTAPHRTGEESAGGGWIWGLGFWGEGRDACEDPNPVIAGTLSFAYEARCRILLLVFSPCCNDADRPTPMCKLQPSGTRRAR